MKKINFTEALTLSKEQFEKLQPETLEALVKDLGAVIVEDYDEDTQDLYLSEEC